MLLRKFVLANSQELAQLWWVDLFILGRDKQRSDTEQMKLALLNLDLAQVLVDDELRHVEALGSEAELAVHIDNPLEEEGAARVTDLCLDFADVGRVDHEALLVGDHRFEDWLREFRKILRVSKVDLVLLRHELHFALDVLLDSAAESLRNLTLMELGVARVELQRFNALVGETDAVESLPDELALVNKHALVLIDSVLLLGRHDAELLLRLGALLLRDGLHLLRLEVVLRTDGLLRQLLLPIMIAKNCDQIW